MECEFLVYKTKLFGNSDVGFYKRKVLLTCDHKASYQYLQNGKYKNICSRHKKVIKERTKGMNLPIIEFIKLAC